MSEFHLISGNRNYSSWSLRPWILMMRLGVKFRETIVPQEWGLLAAKEEPWTLPREEVGLAP